MDNGNNRPFLTETVIPPEVAEAQPQGDIWLERSQVLWEGRKLLWKASLAGLLIGLVLAFAIPARYESTVRLMPPESQNGASALLAAMSGNKNVPGGITALAGNLFGLKNTGALFVDLLGSRTVQDHLIDKFQLQKVYWKRYRESARRTLAKRTDISEDRKSGVITVAVSDHDRRRAQQMAQAYVDELDQLVAQVNTSSAGRERLFIEQRIASVKQDLNSAERDLADFSSKNATLDVNNETKAIVESAAELQGQLIAARSELQSLTQIYSDNNVRVRSLKARIGELERQLRKMSGNSATAESLPTDGQSTELYPPLRHMPALGARWLDLYRRVRVQETVFELLTQQYELARIEEAKSIPSVRVIDPPNFPERHSFPPRLLMIFGGALLGLACAIGWLLLRERWREMDGANPRKVFAQQVGHSAASGMRSLLRRKRDLDPAA